MEKQIKRGESARVRELIWIDRGLKNRLYLFHLALAAFFAISERCSLVSFSALALPPFFPPRRPSSTAWGFLSEGTSSRGNSAVARSTMLLARALMSVGSFFFFMSTIQHDRSSISNPRKFKLTHYRKNNLLGNYQWIDYTSTDNFYTWIDNISILNMRRD